MTETTPPNWRERWATGGITATPESAHAPEPEPEPEPVAPTIGFFAATPVHDDNDSVEEE